MSSKIVSEVMDANAKYVGSFGDKGQLEIVPALGALRSSHVWTRDWIQPNMQAFPKATPM